MAILRDVRVIVLVTDGFEEAELLEPAGALGEVGAKIEIVAPHDGRIQAFRHHDKSIMLPVDKRLDQADPAEYDAVLLPGGVLNADALRMDTRAQELLCALGEAGKPMAVICHAPWELISAGLARGRTMTSYPTIQDDIPNAGAHWTDEEVVADGNLVTSRQPADIPAFTREMLKLFAERLAESAHAS